MSERKADFREVKLGFDEEMAGREAQRCMTCGSKASINYVDDCQLCLYCERDCPQKAISGVSGQESRSRGGMGMIFVNRRG